MSHSGSSLQGTTISNAFLDSSSAHCKTIFIKIASDKLFYSKHNCFTVLKQLSKLSTNFLISFAFPISVFLMLGSSNTCPLTIFYFQTTFLMLRIKMHKNHQCYVAVS